MIEQDRVADEATGDYIEFRTAGERAKGAFRCVECGYGVAIALELPRCPMCSGEQWETAEWSPFARARREL